MTLRGLINKLIEIESEDDERRYCHVFWKDNVDYLEISEVEIKDVTFFDEYHSVIVLK
jgi:hypothetical protein